VYTGGGRRPGHFSHVVLFTVAQNSPFVQVAYLGGGDHSDSHQYF
jgi:phage gp37-like protein